MDIVSTSPQKCKYDVLKGWFYCDVGRNLNAALAYAQSTARITNTPAAIEAHRMAVRAWTDHARSCAGSSSYPKEW